MSKYSFVYPPLGKRLLAAVARRTPGLASRSNKPIEGKRCVAFTANKRPCRARPLAGSQLCPMHTPGMAQALGSRGGAAGVGAQALRARREAAWGDVVAGVPRGVSLASIVEHDALPGGDATSPILGSALSEISLTQPVGVDPVGAEGDPSPGQISSSSFDPMARMREMAALQNLKEREIPDPSLLRPHEQYDFGWDNSP